MSSLISKVVDNVDGFLDYLSGQAKQSLSDYCDIETADTEDVLVSKDGSFLSIVEVSGIKKLIGNTTLYDDVIAPLKTSLQSSFETKAHMVQMVFELDPDRTREEIHDTLAPARSTCEAIGMDMNDLLEERETNLTNWTSSESCYLVLWTRPEALTKADHRNEKKERMSKRKKVVISTLDGQNPLTGFKALRDRHGSFVSAVQTELNHVGISSDLLDSHAAVRAIRMGVDLSFTGKDWQPSLPGDIINPSLRKSIPMAESWDIVWPKIGWQVCPRDAKVIADNVVEIGNRIYSPIYIDLFPRELRPFANLFARIISKDLPFRISYLLEGDGLSGYQFKNAISQILGFAGAGNKMVNRAITGLTQFKEHGGGTVVKIRVALCTWADKGQESLLSRRTSDLARCIEGWGSCQVSEVTGDPFAGLASSFLGFSSGSIGTPAAAPLEDALMMMPLTRPSSPWKTGAVTFRSPDGKLMPYQPYSNLQTTWINLIFAKPGSGKSVLMNMCNLALCMAGGLQNLPRIAIVDIGPSSSGLISLLREALSEDKKHLVLHHRLRMVESDAINPFDTQLGCRVPTPSELSFLRNFVTLLVTDMNMDRPYDGMTGLVSAVIDEVYRMRSDRCEPNLYTDNLYPKVDALIKSLGLRVDSKTTWWEIVDGLFDKGYHNEAALAQRQASPLLADCSGAAQTEKVRATYGTMKTQSGEALTSAFSRLISEAMDFFSILVRPTAFDIGGARVVALDLDEVAKSGGTVSDRVTAVMYMLARQVLAKDFYLNDKVVEEMPAPSHIVLRETVPVEKYRAYHLIRIKEIQESPKRICYDEFHRTKNSMQVREQVLLDMREGRKWKVDVMLSSQALEDFDKTMIGFATGIFVMDGGNAQTVADIATVFGFDDPAEKYSLQHRVHGPRAGGGTFLAKFATTSGWYTMLLSATLGPVELWAFSTTTEDVSIRTSLYSALGPKRARAVLAQKYPGGSAMKDVESRRTNMQGNGDFEEKSKNVLEQIVEELVQYARSM